MGCSVSHPSHQFPITTTITTTATPNPPPISPNSSPSPPNFTSPSSDHCYNSSSTQTPVSVSRTLSLPTPLIHHPPAHKGDSNHFVSLTSTTYGSLIAADPAAVDSTAGSFKTLEEFQECSVFSSPDSVINTWELMEGLDEDWELDVFQKFGSNSKKSKSKLGSEPYVSFGLGGPYEMVEYEEIKPLWKHLSKESLLSKLDSSLVSSYNQALCSKKSKLDSVSVKESPNFDSNPKRGFCLSGCEDRIFLDSNLVSSYNQALCSKRSNLGNVTNSVSVKENPNLDSNLDTDSNPKRGFCLSGCEDRIVLYYTTLRGIRKTYEDCCEIRLILKGFRVFVDERDISMDSSYKKELKSVFEGKGFTLPQVFIKGKCIGGADEIKRLHEEGKLYDLVKGFPVVDPRVVCGSCGDARFVPCLNCSGSRKVFEEGEGRAVRCPDCNENGLIRCAACCS